MKIKKHIAVLIVCFILTSCAPAVNVVPTETAIPFFTPTVTVTSLPTVTSTPDYTPTPTSIPQVWLDSVKQFEGELDPIQKIEGSGWRIDGVTFDPASLKAFPQDNESGGDKEPRFGLDEAGQVQLRCYGEITLPNGEKVVSGFLWFQKLHNPNIPGFTWEGVNYLLGSGVFGGAEAGEPYCSKVISTLLSEGKYSTSLILVFNQPFEIKTDRDRLLEPLLTELLPPDEFWQFGDVDLLPQLMEKPFLLATHFMFKENK